MKKIIFMALLGFALNTAYGGIEWKYRELSIEAQSGQNSVDAVFPFTITGVESVGIISTKSSNPNLTIEPVSGELKPGTEGELKVHYMLQKGVIGTIAGSITVETTDSQNPSIELNLMVYLPLTYRIDPKYAFWNLGADPDAKDIYFVDITGKGYKPVAIYSTSVNFKATLIPPEGKATRYIIRIKPVSTDVAGAAQVFVDVDMGDGTIEKRSILTAIRDPHDPKIKMISR